MQRRRFLKGLAAAPFIVPAAVLGRGQRVAPSDRIVMAGVGVGGMGGGHLRSFTGSPDVQMVAVCDVRREHRDRAKNHVDMAYDNDDCQTFNDYRELLARDDIDAIFMATPDHWHALVGIEAARRGKHMYYEKPLTMSVQESHAVRDAVKKHGVVFQFGTQQRSNVRFRRAVELAWNGYLGEMTRIQIGSASYDQVPYQPEEPVPEGLDYDMWLGPAPYAPFTTQRCTRNWTLINDYSLGCLSGAWGIHHVDIAQLTNRADDTEPVAVEGWGYFPTDGFYDTAQHFKVEHTYANGFKLIHMDMNTAIKEDERFNLHWMGILFEGTEGWIYVARDAYYAEPKSLITQKIAPTDERIQPFSDDHRQNFLDSVRGISQPASPIDAAFHSDVTCHQAYAAMRVERPLQWNPKTTSFVNDDQANRYLHRAMRQPWHL